MAANVGYATLQIIPSAQGFAAALHGQTVGAMGVAGTKGGAAMGKKATGSFLPIMKGLVGPMAAIFAVDKVVDFGKSVIAAASDVDESVNAVSVTFGENAKGILDLGESAARALGLSKTEFNGLAVRFSSFASTVAGKGGDVTGTMKDLTTRAADFASVMNIDVAEAAELFQSGLAGETEPLRRFGMDLSAAAVESYAYANGIAKTGEELTEAQKVQARYGSLMEQTAKTQGDFSNTSDSLANRQRILGATWENLKARLGTGLLPIAERAMGVFQGLVDRVFSLGSAFAPGGSLGGGLSFVQTALGRLREYGEPILAAFRDVGQGLMDTWGPVKEFLAPLVAIVRDFATQAAEFLGPALRSIGDTINNTFLPGVRAILPVLQPVAAFILQTIGGAIMGALRGAVDVVQGVFKAIGSLFSAFAALFRGDWSALWTHLKNFASGIWQAIKGAFQVWLNVGILKVFKVGLGLIKGAWGGLWSGLKSVGSSAMSGLKGLVSSGVNAVKGFFVNGFNAIKGGVSSALDGVVGVVRGIPGRIISALGNVGSLLLNVGKNLIRGFINGIKSMVGAVANAVREAVGGVVGFAKNLLGIHSPSREFMKIGRFTGQGFAIGVEDSARLAQKAMAKVVSPPDSPTIGASVSGASAAGGPLVGSLTLQSRGDTRSDLEEALFLLRRVRRGGSYALA